MNKDPLKENSFDAAPGGMGSISTQPGYGTFSGPLNSQNPSNFESSNLNKTLGANSNTAKEAPDSGSMQRNLSTIFSKKPTPSPDEVVMGIKYELGQQIKKDRRKAKEMVIANLKKDPKFYSSLKMLNIDDDSMVNNMNENKKHPNDKVNSELKISNNINETKKIFEDMVKSQGNRYVVNSHIVDAMRDTMKRKEERNSWRNKG